MENNADKKFDPEELPQNKVFKTKELDQYKQPPGRGKPVPDEGNNSTSALQGKDAEKTSKEEGLNEANSTGNAGAFEGFEGNRDLD